MKKGKIKQIGCCLIAFLMVLSMIGCNDDSVAVTNSSNSGDQLQTSEVTTEMEPSSTVEEDTTGPFATEQPTSENATDAVGPVAETSKEITGEPNEENNAPVQTEFTEATKPKATEPKVTEPPHSHNYTSKVTAPTCTADGYTTYSCSCGNSYTDNAVAATGHSWSEWETTKEATADEEGEQKRACNICGTEEAQSIDKLPAEEINLAELEAYGRSYGVSAYGFEANPGCYAGYFPAYHCTINTMEEGRAAVREKVDSTATNLLASGPVWGELEDGTIWRAYINVAVIHDGGNYYWIYVYYG